MDELDLNKIDNSEDCISAYDDNLTIVVWNKALAGKYNIAAAQAIGKGLLELFPQIANDFRVKCFLECLSEKKTFYFANLPYHFQDAIYTQLIIPIHTPDKGWSVMSIVRDHKDGEHYTGAELLASAGLKELRPHHDVEYSL